MLDLFKRNDKLKEEKLHDKFKLLRDEIQFKGQREILCSWTEGLRDRDNKIVDEFQQTFHSSFWEFYLFAVFREANFKMNQKYHRPDFIIESPEGFYVEAVTSNIKKGGRQESERGMNDILDALLPPTLNPGFDEMINEAIVRYASSMRDKNKKIIDHYLKDKHVKMDRPFLIALGSFDQVNYGGEYIYPMMALLYGYYYNSKTKIYEKKESILKPGTTSEIALGIFNKPEFENVSAIIFSCTATMGKLESMAISQKKSLFQSVYNIRRDFEDTDIPYKLHKVSFDQPESLTDGLFIFHNPKCKNKLPKETFENTFATQFFIQDEMIVHTSNTAPIVGRINIPSILDQQVEIFLTGCLMEYNNKSLEEIVK